MALDGTTALSTNAPRSPSPGSSRSSDSDQPSQDLTSTSAACHPPSDTAAPSSEGLSAPSPDDVICGRGKMTIAHPGNRRFRDLVLSKKRAYQLATRRDDKTKITFDLVKTLRAAGSKFLLFDAKTNLWYDVGDEYAREKVSHSLRSRPNERRQSSTSKPKPRKKPNTVRKTPQHSPALDNLASQLIDAQQALLKAMIEKETSYLPTIHTSENPSR